MKTIAIVMGVSSYRESAFKSIPGAQADARRFSTALLSWGIPKEWIYSLYNEQATKSNVIKTFYDCRSAFDNDAKLIIYFAGHGVRQNYLEQSAPESSLIMHDTVYDDIFHSGLRLVELMQLIRSLKPAQVFLFIDACNLRLNQIENPLNDADILSTTNSKGLFCLFSAGIDKSYEDAKFKYGYFTSALLKAIAELRLDPQANCHDITRKVSTALSKQELPIPEVYHIGGNYLWPLEKSYENDARINAEGLNFFVLRWEALAKLQDHLLTLPDPIIWMWGEGGKGKTVIAEQMSKKNPSAVYATIPSVSSSYAISMQTLIEQIRSQKSELFFNRPPETSLKQILSHIACNQADTIIILDHLDRLVSDDLNQILSEIDQSSLPCILISRKPCPTHFFTIRASKIFEWEALPLGLEEIQQIVEESGQDPSFCSTLLHASKGNALRVRQMIAKLSGQDFSIQESMSQDYILAVKSIVVCGGFLDEHLFCEIFKIKSSVLISLEKLGLIRYTKEGCIPHDLLAEMIDDNKWSLDVNKACEYWHFQISHTPYNRWACRSLVILSSQNECNKAFKNSLRQCLETLNERENLRFLIDLVRIFQEEHWEDLLLKSSDYLIDHEEYLLAGEVLQHLLHSDNSFIRNHASKNDARRLVWCGNFSFCIQLYESVLKKCRSPKVLVPLKNNIGLAFFFMGNLKEAFHLFQENLNYKGKKEEIEIGVAKYMIGMIMTYTGENITKAKHLIENSLQTFETLKSYLWLIVGLNGLSDVSYRLEKWRQALHYLKKAADTAEALQNKTFLLFTLKNLARVYLRLLGSDQNELSKTVEKMEQILIQTKDYGDTWVTVWAQNTLATVYAYRKETSKLQNMMEIVAPKTVNYKECYIFTLSNLGHLAALKRDESAAKNYYQQAYRLAEELNNQFAIQEIRQDFIGCSLPLYLQDFPNLESIFKTKKRKSLCHQM